VGAQGLEPWTDGLKGRAVNAADASNHASPRSVDFKPVPATVPAALGAPDPIAAARALLDQAARAPDPAPFLAAARALLGTSGAEAERSVTRSMTQRRA